MDKMSEMSRRKLLASVAATAATAAFEMVAISLPAAAESGSPADLNLFVQLSAKLTGIDALKLAPFIDPIEIKSEYFAAAKKAGGATFDSMLQAFKNSSTDETVANFLRAGSDKRYLARSIILAWYLGAWYEPGTLDAEANQSQEAKANHPSTAAANKPSARRYNLVKCRILSPESYSQGWVWRVAQAHPMGYGNLQFGYWSKQPPSLDAFIKSKS
jgi:hypothetical protein